MNIKEIYKPMFTVFSRKHNIIPVIAKPIVLVSSLVFWLLVQPAEAALTFRFNYLDTGQGFDDPTFGNKRKAALNSAARILGAYFSNYNADLTYNVRSSNVNEPTLASSGSFSYLVPGSFQQSSIQTKIISNGLNDVNGSSADANISWNFSEKWSLSDTVATNELDFKQVAVHELLHTFGFNSDINEGGKGLGGNAPGMADTWSTFDSFLTDAAGNSLISRNGVFDRSKIADLIGGSSVFFNGVNAMAANGGAEVPIYSPTMWRAGSSISHLDDGSLTTTQLLMSPSINTGLGLRTLSSIEIGILKDLGYSNIAATSSVPLPAGIWLMASGLLALFGANRRRKPAVLTSVH